MKNGKWLLKDRIVDADFIETCNSAFSMAEAASKLGLHFNSFKKRALILGCYKPNQSGKGLSKKAPKILLEDIVYKNLYPHYQSFKLKKRLIQEGFKKHECERADFQWQNKPLSLELHHRDGDRTNHHITNICCFVQIAIVKLRLFVQRTEKI
ncbi:MAG: hypothetical protein IPM82_30100 [Saprospiraceae bacterium]|nr:hypothetical protein [Saprospiraceae bacterium]